MATAYFITFSTYGTWLHGAGKGDGSVDRHHNRYGTPFIAPDDERKERAAARMTAPPYSMNETARTIVRDAIVELCKEKDWMLLALHVRTNHVHAVIAAHREPGRLMSDLKARASRELNRRERAAHEASGNPAKRWTRHGSTRHLFNDASVAAAVAYTLDEQGPPMAVYDPRNGATHEKRAAHEVSGTTNCNAPGTGNPLTSCAAPPRAASRTISGLNAYEQ